MVILDLYTSMRSFLIFIEKLLCVTSHASVIKVSRDLKKLALKSKPWISNKIEYMMANRAVYLRKFNRTLTRTWNICIRSSETKWCLNCEKVRLSTIPNISVHTGPI